MLSRVLTVIALTLGLAASASVAQHAPDAKKFELRGKITDVGKDRLTVNHSEVKGYMAAMTMPYKVEKPDVLSKLKAGDSIIATVYENDYTLYDIKVVPPEGKSK